MPRYNVEADGEWACFSTIPDQFITPFMSLDEYEKWRDEQYGKNKYPLEECNRMTLREALQDMSIYNSDDEIIKNLREVGLIGECEVEE